MSGFVTSYEVRKTDIKNERSPMELYAARQPETVEDRLLRTFDLSESDIRDRVVLRAHHAAQEFDRGLYPPGSPGSVRYFELVNTLSQVLRPRGWRRDDKQNICRLVNDDRRIVLVVTSGDEATGIPYLTFKKYPRSKYPKGVAMRSAVDNNQSAFDFAEYGLGTPQESNDAYSGYSLWTLMVFVNSHEIRSEISKPIGFDGHGRIAGWDERIILHPVPNDGAAIDIDLIEPDTPDAEIDIPVSRL
ncbi:hypothetical protein [Arthrobacter globiformis]|uniref:hypothetical protein n=1 Tax=Arthrobacter globiformis TaxID=1665 RepID=UPI00167D158A|nr:hypothetical protein [Arthrobacter globiformis]